MPLIKRAGALPSYGRMKEIGCGMGHKLEVIHRSSSGRPDIHGMEVFPEMLAAGRIKYPHLNMEEGDALNLDTTSKYDVIFLLKVLQHFTRDEVANCLQQTANYLEERGKIVVLNRIFAEKGVRRIIEKLLVNGWARIFGLSPDHYMNLTLRELAEVLEESGLKIADHHKISLLGDLIILEKKVA
jgi:trans-aconitate methyltransferase